MSKILLQITLDLTLLRGLLTFVMLLFFGVSWGQSLDDYRTRQSGNWNSLTTWERFNGASWQALTGITPLTLPTSADGVITIQNAHTITVTSSVTVDQVIVAAGGQITINSGITLTINNGSGTDMTVAGTIQTNSTSNSAGFVNNGSIAFGAGSTYIHNVNGESLPTATWAPTSTVRITGTSTSDPSGFAQTFGNFIWNATALGTNNVNFNPIAIAGRLEINNGTATGQIIQTNANLSIAGDFVLSGGVYSIASGTNVTRTLNVAGNVSISSGTLRVKQSTGGSGNFNVLGNFSHTGGTITRTGSGTAAINFNGSGSPQIFTSGGTISGAINWTVNSGAFLQMAAESTTVGGSGTFTLASGGTLGITSAAGISSSGATGNIRVTGTRSFNSGGNYIYNGSTNQTVGNGLPTTLANLTISNSGAAGSNTVTMDANRSVTANLSILQGTFNLGTFTSNRSAAGGTFTLAANTTLLVGGASNFPGNYSTNALDCSSTVNYNLSGNQTVGAVNYGNLILSGSGTKTLQTGTTQICTDFSLAGTAQAIGVVGLTIDRNVSIGSGATFNAGNFTHSVGGNWIRSGTFTPGTSTVNFSGANPATIDPSTFNNLTFSGAGSKTALGNLTINGNVLISGNFTAGDFSHTIGGNWTNNGAFTAGTGTISFTATAARSISGTAPTAFFSLIVSNPGGISVSSPISVATTLTLSAGNLAASSNLTMGDGSSIVLTAPSATMSGAIQGSGDYDVTYQGGSRNTSSELSGAELRNVVLTSTSGSTLTATSDFTMKGLLTIPTGVTLQMVGFSIGPRLISTSGSGQLLTLSTSSNPLPADVTWSFPVRFARSNGGQSVPFGSYEVLDIQSSTGITTLAAEGLGDVVIRNQFTVTAVSTVNASQSRVIFSANAAQMIPGLAYRKLSISGSGNKTFAASTTVERELVITSSAVALLGNTNRSVETLILNGASQAVGSYGSTASAAVNRPATFFGTAGTGILFVTSVCLDGKWEGAVSTDWFDPANWCSGSVPAATTDVTIPATVNLPVINTTGATLRNITIESGASLTMTGTSGLSIRGNWVNNGTFSSGTGTITFQGTSAQTISGSSTNSFRNLVIANTSGGVSLSAISTVTGTLTLSQGVFTLGTNFSMGSGSELIRTAGSITGTLQGTNAYDVSYTGNSKSSGPELVNSGLRNVIVNLTVGQTLTLGTAPALPDGNLSLTGGRLNTGTNSIDRSAAGGTLTIGSGTTFITTRNGTDAFPLMYATRVIDASSTVEYTGTNQTVADNTYGNLILGGISGLKSFAGAVTIVGNLSILATTSANLGTATSATNTLTLGGTGQPNGSYGSTLSAALYKNSTYFGTTATGILNVTTSTLVCGNGYWIGGTSTDWFAVSNWCNGTLPVATTDVIIPAVAPFKPVINATGAVLRNLSIESGASLVVSGSQVLAVNGNWANSGLFSPGTSTVTFAGPAAQSVTGITTFSSVNSNNPAGISLNSPTSISGTLSLTSGVLAAGSNLTLNTNAEIIRTNGSMTGSIQGTNNYNLTYQGVSKTTGAEVTGANLNNVTLSLNSGQTLTAGGNFGLRGVLTIPANVVLNMVGFQLSGNTLTTAGSGTLSTQNTSTTPLPLNRSWSFPVLYNNLSGGQRVVAGVYHELTVQLNSGTTTFSPDSDGTIEIASGNFTRTGTGGTISAALSTVVFSGTGAQNLPPISFHNLQLIGSGNKFFTGTQNITGNLTISGTAVARLGSANRTVETLTLGTVGQPVGSYGSTASAAVFKRPAFFGTADLGLINVTTSTAICIDGTWQGTVSSDWFTAANWCDNVIPTILIDVFIPSTAPFQPVIGANGAVAQNVVVESGASLGITGAFTLTVGGDWQINGTFSPGTSSTVDFSGDEAGVIGESSFASVAFTGTGVKTIAGTLSVSGNALPISTEVNLSDPFTFLVQPGRSMRIESDGQVNTSGDSKIILSPSSNFINLGASSPTLEVQQTLTGTKGWRLIGSPINTTYVSLTDGFETQGFPGATNPTLQPNLLWWDETDKGTTLQGWRQPNAISENVPAGRGHYFYVFDGESKPGGGTYSDELPITMSVTGSEVNLATETFDFEVTFTQRDTSLIAQEDSLIEVNQADEGFNLIANPTASVIDFHAAIGWTKTNLDQSIYVWDPASSSFLTWNGTTGSLGSGRIAPFQGFWVKTNAASPLLRLDGNAPKSNLSTDFFGRKQAEPTSILELNVIGEGMSASSYLSFGEDGLLGADAKDAYQLESLAEDWLLLYSFGSLRTKSPLVINHQPSLTGKEDRVIPLHLAAARNGEPFKGAFLMDWKLPASWNADYSLVLMDHINQKAIDMKKESVYAFEFEAPKSASSFTRKDTQSALKPRAVVFQTPYSLDEEEIITNARTSTDSKPKRPFTLFVGRFPDGKVEYLPDFPKLFSPAPNPFVQQTKIRFFLPVAEQAEVKIFSLLGQEVGGFPTQEYGAGIHELDWIPQAISIPPGIYIIRLVTPTGQFTQKLIKN